MHPFIRIGHNSTYFLADKQLLLGKSRNWSIMWINVDRRFFFISSSPSSRYLSACSFSVPLSLSLSLFSFWWTQLSGLGYELAACLTWLNSSTVLTHSSTSTNRRIERAAVDSAVPSKYTFSQRKKKITKKRMKWDERWFKRHILRRKTIKTRHSETSVNSSRPLMWQSPFFFSWRSPGSFVAVRTGGQ